jgi:hypothetical protein
MEAQNTIGEASKPPRRAWRTNVQLGVTRGLYRRLRQRAKVEGLSFAGWLRRVAMRELRRKPTV